MAANIASDRVKTQVLPVHDCPEGHFEQRQGGTSVDTWVLPENDSLQLQTLRDAAQLLRTSNIPIAFPTETVYGLGADATRSESVRGIYKAKGRPSDNPLIIHISDLDMLRSLLSSPSSDTFCDDPFPSIYKPLIERFWPGPLTILLPNPENSKLAPEVTAGLKTFAVRMPKLPLALSLIKLAGVPIAGPSANASTKPSPTTAQHVLHDLDGRIEYILDGGACDVGVESTVVDGLCSPPVVLRPGGVSMDLIEECEGWENVRKGYKDEAQIGDEAPRAPGMKYKHYSPNAKVVLVEAGADFVAKDLTDLWLEFGKPTTETMETHSGLPYESSKDGKSFHLPVIGIVRTRYWGPWAGWNESDWTHVVPIEDDNKQGGTREVGIIREGELSSNGQDSLPLARFMEIALGTDTKSVAHGLFSALRDLDQRNPDIIYVEGIEEEDGDIAAAVMNRLRKAASEVRM